MKRNYRATLKVFYINIEFFFSFMTNISYLFEIHYFNVKTV